MRILVTGGSGILRRTLRPLAAAARHDLTMPTHVALDLFDPDAVTAALREVDAVMHLATRIRRLDLVNKPEAWRDNNRLRAEASKILVDAALRTQVAVSVQPTATLLYPIEGPVSEETPLQP